jgi:putative ABC transport system permease protein
MEFAVHRGRGWAKLVSDTGSMQAGITGIDIRSEPKFSSVLQLESGKLEDLAQPGTILLFDNQAEKLGVKVGDALTISAPTTRGTNNTIDVRIVAIAHSLGLLSTWNCFIPIESLRALYQINQDATGVIQIMLNRKDFDHIPAIAARLRQALDQAGYRIMEPDPRAFWMKFQSVSREDWTGQKLDVTNWEDEISFMTWTLKALEGMSAVLIVILVAIIIIGIMNTMWIAIRERTREIGTLRAIGMHRREVLWMFLLESLMLGLLATIVGVLMGAAIAAGLNAAHVPVPTGLQFFLMSPHLHLAVHGSLMIRAILIITFVTGAAAFYPSLKAARLRPVVAMSHFG